MAVVIICNMWKSALNFLEFGPKTWPESQYLKISVLKNNISPLIIRKLSFQLYYFKNISHEIAASQNLSSFPIRRHHVDFIQLHIYRRTLAKTLSEICSQSYKYWKSAQYFFLKNYLNKYKKWRYKALYENKMIVESNFLYTDNCQYAQSY